MSKRERQALSPSARRPARRLRPDALRSGIAAPTSRGQAPVQRLLEFQGMVGNGTVARLLRGGRGSTARPDAPQSTARISRVASSPGLEGRVQRHSSQAFAAQLEAAELEEEALLQRSPDRTQPYAAGSPTASRAVQRHPLPRNRQFGEAAAPTEEKVNALTRLVDAEMPRIVAQLKTSLRSRVDDARLDGLTEKVCQKDPAFNVGLSSPAAANDSGFAFMLRSPYYYTKDGDPDEEFVRATLIHETMHFLSFAHTGLQNVEYADASGAKVAIGEGATAKDSLDEAMTERVSREIYEILYPRSPYKTNYWQSLREAGVHLTVQGLKNATRVARQFQERNWTGGIADLVEKENLLTKDQLEGLYLRGEGAIADPAILQNFKANYGRILALWHSSKKDAWKYDIPAGVMPADEWVKLVNGILEWASSNAMPEAMALELVADKSNGHELVSPDDPRSHVYGAATATAFEDDLTILKKYYPDSPKASQALPPSDKPEPGGWKGSKVGYDKGANRYSSDAVRQAVQDHGRRLKLKTFPHVVVPAADTLGGTPFKNYEAAAFFPPVSPVKSKSMSELSGVEEGAKVVEVISGKGGGAYETNGQIIYANSLEERTLLHELGHYKQDIGTGSEQFTERNINPKLLEYHNIVIYENPPEATKPQANRFVRLSYSRKPMVRKFTLWASQLTSVQPGEPEQFKLLKKLATPKELEAIAQIEAKLAEQTGEIYTDKMVSYLKRQLAAEYFSASKYAQF